MKALTLWEQANRVERAWDLLYPWMDGGPMPPMLHAVYEDYVIIRLPDDRLAKAGWSLNDDGAVTFDARDTWEIVEQEFVAIKAIKGDNGEWILDVLGVPFGGPYGGKDAQGEYFTPDTALWLDRIPKRPVVYYHGLREGGEEPAQIGEELGWEVKSDGVWFRVMLDKTSALAARVWEAAQKGLARASSGAIGHLARVAQGGKIEVWPVGELSLMDLDGRNQPANPYAIAFPAKAMKSVYDRVGYRWPDEWNERDARAEGPDQRLRQGIGDQDASDAVSQTQKQRAQAQARGWLALLDLSED